MKQRLKSILLNFDDILAGISLAVIVIITVIGVFMRYVVGNPLAWTEEVSLALIVWFVFLGASSAMKRRAHISIDFFVAMLPRKLRIVSDVIVIIANFIVLSFLVVFGYQLTMQAGVKLTPILRLPYTYIDIAVPLGSALMLVSLIRRSINLKDYYKREKE
ncbi:MAG: TRAP transporter small permease [Clostridia bacterium]